MAKISINLKKGALEKAEVVVGIDLGTTNSLVARAAQDGVPYCLGKADNLIVPSVVYFDNEGRPWVGETAKKALIHHPESTIFSVKRLLGRSYQDVEKHADFYTYHIVDDNSEGHVKIAITGKYYTPVELSALILKEMKLRAETELGVPVNKAVITVPAYFNDSQRQATRDAGKLAGLEVLRIINEPTAASLAYGLGLNPSETRTILVYDLGGGTFDVSVLLIENGVFEVLSTDGDTWLGGDDVDRKIAERWLESAGYTFARIPVTTRQEIRLMAEEAKITVSRGEGNYSNFITLENKQIALNLEESDLEDASRAIVDKSMQLVMKALKAAGLTASEIDDVVLVGGSTRLPHLRRTLKNTFGHARVNHSLNPDEVVALGAAVEADILAGNRRDLLLLDVTPLSLGIETAGGLMDVIIPRNHKIPAKATRQYTTSVDGQLNMRIDVYQGERELVSENRKLSGFILQGIPAMPAGLPKVEVSFALDADGILRVSAHELRSGVHQEIEVLPRYGLTDDMVEQMLLDSLKFAGEDMAARLLLEARTEARQLIYTAKRFIEKNSEWLSTDEIASTQKFIEELEKAIETDNRNRIHECTEALNEFTKPFAERIMDQAIGKALKGTSIEE